MMSGTSRLRFLSALALSAVLGIAEQSPAISKIQNRSGGTGAAAGDVVDLLGSNLGFGDYSADGFPLPLNWRGTQVMCNDYVAPILEVHPDRVRIQIPWESAKYSSVDVRVIVESAISPPYSLPLSTFAPLILGVSTSSGAAGQPVNLGQTVTLKVSGMGPRVGNPPTGSGGDVSKWPGAVMARFIVKIGTVPAPVVSTQTSNSGNVQNDTGVEDVVIKVPSNITAGDDTGVRIEIGDLVSDTFPIPTSSAGGVTMTLRPEGIVSVGFGGSVKFSAVVQGSSEQKVVWSLDSFDSRTYPAGSIDSSSGSYFAGYSYPSWMVVRATHASGAIGTALVQLTAQDNQRYRIVPENPVIAPGESVSFRLLDQDGNDVRGATFNTGSTYTASMQFPDPQILVLAAKPGQGNYVAATTIYVSPPRVNINATSPAVGHVGQPLTLQATGFTGGNAWVWFTMADGSRTRALADYTLTTTVPRGAVSGPAWLEVETRSSSLGSTYFWPFTATILPRLRLHPSRLRISSGEQIQITAAAPDQPGAWPLYWRADAGTIDNNGTFTAETVSADKFARIWACHQYTTSCYSTIVDMAPLRLEPDPTIVRVGETTKLEAWSGNRPANATWRSLTANVTVQPDGTLIPGSGTFDGGRALVSATGAYGTQTFEVSIAAPGSVAHTAEFYDWLGYDNNSTNSRLALGVFAEQVAVRGNWMYVIANSLQFNGGPYEMRWMDVYELDEKHRPVWKGSTEAPTGRFGSNPLSVDGNKLNLLGSEGQYPEQYILLIQYDISNGMPVNKVRRTIDGTAASFRTQGFDFKVISADPNHPVEQLSIEVTNYGDGTVRRVPFSYSPAEPNFNMTVTGTASWAAITFQYAQSGQYETAIFDISGPSAVMLSIVPSGGFNGAAVAFEDVLFIAGDVYSVSNQTVTLASQLTVGSVLAKDYASKRLLVVQQEGHRVVDVSDPFHPKLSAPAVIPQQSASGALGPDYFVLLGLEQQAGIYPIQWTTGVSLLDVFPSSAFMTDLKIRDGYLYWTGAGFGFQGRTQTPDLFETVDLNSGPPFRVTATFSRPLDEIGWAVELSGNSVYVGTDSELLVYDISTPSRPVQVGVIPEPAYSLAAAGNLLYVGTLSGAARAPFLAIYDISNPAKPVKLNSVPLTGNPYKIAVQPGWLAVAEGKAGLFVFTTNDPTQPVAVQSAWRSGTYWDITASGKLLYSAADFNGLVIWDMSTPASPNIVSSTPLILGHFTSLYPYALSVSLDGRGIAWLCTDSNGSAYGMDVRSPAFPRHVMEFPTGVGEGSSATVAVTPKGMVVIAGNDVAFETSASQNIGLFEVQQPFPWQLFPDRYSERPPAEKTLEPQPLKAKAFLRKQQGLPPERPAAAAQRQGVRF